MRILQLTDAQGYDIGLFNFNQDKDPTEQINLCLSRAETNYENDLDGDQELVEHFINALEEDGIVRVFAEDFNVNINL